MERNYMGPESLIELDFITEQYTGVHTHENIELLFVIYGKLIVEIEQDTYQLNPGDCILVNIGKKHSYNASKDILMGRFLISGQRFKELLGQNILLFWCNSSTEENDAYDELKRIIVKIFNQTIYKNSSSKILLKSLHYQMLNCISSNFLLTTQDFTAESARKNKDDRINDISNYINANYRQSITLDDLAGELYLSQTYVSKYIKKKYGVNFVQLVNKIRLNHAMEAMLYTDDSIIKIAMDNGFANVASFDKVFKEAYNITPSEYRKKLTVDKTVIVENGDDKNISLRVEHYIESNESESQDDGETVEQKIVLEDLDKIECKWGKSTCKVINAGTALDMTKSTFQEQIINSKESLGFEYVRFWDIYAPEMYIDIHASAEKQNYSRLNAITDFLVKNKLKPYIELGNKPIRILKNMNEAIIDHHNNFEFSSDEEMNRFYEDFIQHFLNRYGLEEVSSWYFEYWEKTNINYSGNMYTFNPIEEKAHRRYFHEFGIVASAFRKHLPKVNIGGGGFPVRMYGKAGFSQVLTMWKSETEKPSFLSFSCYPYIQGTEEEGYFEKRSTDVDFISHSLDVIHESLELATFDKVPIHVTEYNLTLSNRNIINDSVMKGAYIARNAISTNNRADVIAHWLFTDAYSDEWDSRNLLFGGCGILTKDGIAKPSYYAMEFINRLYGDIVYMNENVVVTVNDRGSIRMLCHNMKKLNYNYYVSKESDIKYDDLLGLYDDMEHLKIHFDIRVKKATTYKIKQNRITRNKGSVLDQWEKLNMESNLTLREMNYLKNISVSEIDIVEQEAKEQMLHFDIELEGNEIRYVHILQK